MLNVITSPLLNDLHHGFFSRVGGTSKGIYEGLNCGRGSDDDPAAVMANRAMVADWMGVSQDHVQSVHQVHSPDVITVTDPLPEYPKADAMVTNVKGIALGVLSADCMPVLFADKTVGVVGAAHAGWKGAKGGVLQATVKAMCNLGATAQNISATIGPCISQAAYEVGPDFFEAITHDDPQAAQFFEAGSGDRLKFDLPGFGLRALTAAGVGHSTWTGDCTYGDPKRFFSYRRTCHENLADYGRLIACIRL